MEPNRTKPETNGFGYDLDGKKTPGNFGYSSGCSDY